MKNETLLALTTFGGEARPNDTPINLPTKTISREHKHTHKATSLAAFSSSRVRPSLFLPGGPACLPSLGRAATRRTALRTKRRGSEDLRSADYSAAGHTFDCRGTFNRPGEFSKISAPMAITWQRRHHRCAATSSTGWATGSCCNGLASTPALKQISPLIPRNGVMTTHDRSVCEWRPVACGPRGGGCGGRPHPKLLRPDGILECTHFGELCWKRGAKTGTLNVLQWFCPRVRHVWMAVAITSCMSLVPETTVPTTVTARSQLTLTQPRSMVKATDKCTAQKYCDRTCILCGRIAVPPLLIG